MSEKEAQSLSLFQKDFLSLSSCSSKCHHKYGCNKPKRKSEPKTDKRTKTEDFIRNNLVTTKEWGTSIRWNKINIQKNEADSVSTVFVPCNVSIKLKGDDLIFLASSIGPLNEGINNTANADKFLTILIADPNISRSITELSGTASPNTNKQQNSQL